jgi:hypothetical protein
MAAIGFAGLNKRISSKFGAKTEERKGLKIVTQKFCLFQALFLLIQRKEKSCFVLVAEYFLRGYEIFFIRWGMLILYPSN